MTAFDDLSLLRAFVCIVECGSISAAARPPEKSSADSKSSSSAIRGALWRGTLTARYSPDGPYRGGTSSIDGCADHSGSRGRSGPALARGANDAELATCACLQRLTWDSPCHSPRQPFFAGQSERHRRARPQQPPLAADSRGLRRRHSAGKDYGRKRDRTAGRKDRPRIGRFAFLSKTASSGESTRRPDIVAVGHDWRVSILERKGTQTLRSQPGGADASRFASANF